MYINHNSQTMRGTVKRKFAEVDEYPCYPSSSSSSSSSSFPSSLSSPASSEWESDGENISSETRGFRPHSPSLPNTLPSRSILKRHERTGARCSVRFHQVTVFSFPRCQGFTSVPGRGGATLGMARKHSALQRYTVADHALEQQHRRRERLRERAREERLEAFKKKLVTSGAVDQREADVLTVDQVPDEDAGVHVSDAEADNRGFLQPFSSKQRQALLQAAGVKHIDREEKRQLHALRLSREACGCDCQGFCEPETCACSLAGIKCQVDRSSFPCGCSKDSCGNTQGRIEFDSRRVQTHYIHTLMRLELQTTLHDETRTPESQSEPPEELQEYEDPSKQDAPDSCCPFGFALEEDGLPLTMPPTPSFHFIPECLVEEESSCGSDMTEFSSSSDSDTGRYISETLLEVDGGPTHARSLCDCKNNKYSSCSHRRHTGDSSSSADTVGPRTDDLFTDGTGWTSVTGYLEENANQARDIFEDDSLQDFPRTPSPSLDYSLGAYMDLSLSSGSDLEFFDSDYPSGPMHSSFKGHRHTDSFQHLQLFSAFSRPSYESSTQLLESLIGLTEPSTEQIYSVAGTQLL
ncbi:cysteine/serine-rich nuclear protein 1-like [Salarias fasciatus]|uniref:Cysteine/serine-rich nuclear protein 1-like n=1 Tax=Salarias fasciatus TaxID=181472 RepID=A0A672IBK1_SALFA|nr:cysteine/serine-rich nuclear protein 1-like [Salarias fasciatus]